MPDRYRSEWSVHMGERKGWMDRESMGGCDKGRDGLVVGGGENNVQKQRGENEK